MLLVCVFDTGLRISVNFSHEKNLLENFLEFVGTSIGMPM